eukprot:TRINITY_DN13480_c0_g1_i1.p2 TRINITY_DN13480_c0_g1~~TRINITY_DN13480_c0_g1_i1.p2  ORF type:complete len:55 (+),score=2.87 TRINITY_DN13480_c0_g1_i1:325-489(+)
MCWDFVIMLEFWVMFCLFPSLQSPLLEEGMIRLLLYILVSAAFSTTRFPIRTLR